MTCDLGSHVRDCGDNVSVLGLAIYGVASDRAHILFLIYFWPLTENLINVLCACCTQK